MGNLMHVPVASTYATGRQDLLAFFVSCLKEADTYDRAAGYFSSTLYDVARSALAGFGKRQGRIRLICSPYLTHEDFAAMERGVSLRATLDKVLLRDVDTLLQDPTTGAALSYVGALVADGTLDVRICYPEQMRHGLFHTKLGIFTDTLGSEIAFIGSANETWRAWSELGNHESFAAFSTWSNPVDAQRVAELKSYFADLWDGRIPGLVTREIPDAPRDQLLEHASNDAEAIVEQIQALLQSDGAASRAPSVNRKQLQAHQRAVLDDWRTNGRRGIVAHVTGAGKTVTAIAAIREWIADGRPALVVVPRELLQRQWREELRQELRDLRPMLLSVGGGLGPRSAWGDALRDQTDPDPSFGPRITIAVQASASSPLFLESVRPGSHLLVVGDEAHSLGAPGAAPLLARLEAVEARLGLSATWERMHDPAGTHRISDFFGRVLEPPFGIADAIAAGRLVPYIYNLAYSRLSDNEEAQYEELTKRISQAVAQTGDSEPSDYLKMLLIRRSRILKNAADKVLIASDIVFQHWKRGQHWLLYCDNRQQVAELVQELDDEGIYALEYHSAMPGDRAATLATFVESGGVLVAIKCLDEGIDLPVLDHAVILASSSNPREFIQRRGRVLRAAPGKALARIWDLVSTSPDGSPMSTNEVERAAAFALDAYNREIVAEVDSLVSLAKQAGRLDLDYEPMEGPDAEKD